MAFIKERYARELLPEGLRRTTAPLMRNAGICDPVPRDIVHTFTTNQEELDFGGARSNDEITRASARHLQERGLEQCRSEELLEHGYF